MEVLRGACIVGQSGGPTSVINASVLGVIQTALAADAITQVLGAENGITGVLKDRLLTWDWRIRRSWSGCVIRPPLPWGPAGKSWRIRIRMSRNTFGFWRYSGNTTCGISSIMAETTRWTPVIKSPNI